MANQYIAMKPVRLCGQLYLIGDIIPEDAVEPKMEQNLIGMGLISHKVSDGVQVAEADAIPEKIEIPITTKDGVMGIKLTPYDLVNALVIMQKPAKEAMADIMTIPSEDMLILIDKLDKRKTVTEACAAQAKSLGESIDNIDTDDGEQDTEGTGQAAGE